MARLRSAFIPFLVGCLVTLLAVALTQSWLPGVPLDPGSWLRSHGVSFDLGSWFTALGDWLKSHKDELSASGALVTGVGLVIAAWALLVNARAQGVAAHTASWNSSRDCLWHFNERWKELYDSRTKAIQVVKTMQTMQYFAHDPDLAVVLNHFDSMAFMGNRKHLDDELAWTNYFDEAADLWNKSTGYIAWRRETKKDWTLYCEYEPWIHRLAKMNERRRTISRREGKPPSPIATSAPKPGDGRGEERPSGKDGAGKG
ncbi:MAG: hypothetical protein E6I72_02710 [Chloroflexi bacterium]|nr:MAG: hypothetical protein E6I72_02710 [Chloroflexota bacterium]